MSKKKSLVIGITGQDGSYLAEYLLELGYEVHGMNRRKSVPNDVNIEKIKDRIKIHQGDLNDAVSIRRLVDMEFDEIYCLGAQSFVQASFEEPYYTFQTNAVGVLTFLEEIRQGSKNTKFYFAATSEMYGGMKQPPYNEDSDFYPRSPYGVAKLAAYWLVKNYREAYGLNCCSGILFNHESPRRGKVFVTQKICDYVKLAEEQDTIGQYGDGRWFCCEPLELGNLDAKRDWGHAKDYVRAMHLILNQSDIKKNNKDRFDDYVVATGTTRSVREFVEIAFRKKLDIVVEWKKGKNPEDEVGVIKGTDVVVVKVNPEFYRPSEVSVLIGDATKARKELRWVPKISFEELVEDMLED